MTPGTCRPRSAASTSCGARTTTSAAEESGGPFDRDYKNAISNELFVQAAAELAVRLGDGGPVYLQRALTVWNWFEASGMINDDLLVNDGLYSATCRNNGDTTWTYNQGVLLGGLVALFRATGDDGYLARARELADASTTSESLHVDGVLTEPCEPTGCDVNGPSFKGIYVRNLGELNRALDDHPYSDYLADQASTAYDHNRTADNEYGLHWAGPIQHVSGATQQSAVDLLVAAQPVGRPGRDHPQPIGLTCAEYVCVVTGPSNVRSSSGRSVPFACTLGEYQSERRVKALSAVVCTEEVVDREMGTLMADLDGTVPAQVVRDVVSAAADDLDGQVPLGALPEFLHRSAVQRLTRLPRWQLVRKPSARRRPSRFVCSKSGHW